MIHSFEYNQKNIKDIGRVVAIRDYIVEIKGLKCAKLNEGITFETGEHGYVLSFDSNSTLVVVLSQSIVTIGTLAARTGSKLRISCGDELVGNIISPLGYILDDEKTLSQKSKPVELDREPLGINSRAIISQPFYTGIVTVDLTLPLGAGQRELIIGERKTGKTDFALHALANQIKQGNIGIYCAIGKQISDIVSVKEWLQKNDVYDQTIIVSTTGKDNPAEIFMAPFTAMALAESMRDNGHNVTVVLDDLTTHAKYYREMSLITGKFPGRDSYPGDIFYWQSKLLERAGCFNINGHTHSISCLPIAESTGGDMTGYIQTNLMSITDGHLYFDVQNYLAGDRPAINIFLSVTRVGRQTRNKLQHQISNIIFNDLKKLNEAESFVKFGPERTAEINSVIAKGNNLKTLLDQKDGYRFKNWEMLFLFICYWQIEKQSEKPKQLLSKLISSGKSENWRKLIDSTDNINDLVSFAKKII